MTLVDILFITYQNVLKPFEIILALKVDRFFASEALIILHINHILFEPVHEKTNNLGFRPGPTQTRLYSHRSRLEA